MKEFTPTDLFRIRWLVVDQAKRACDSLHFISLTSVSNGYVVVARFSWDDGSWHERVILIVEEPYGPCKGELRVGWSNIIDEHYTED